MTACYTIPKLLSDIRYYHHTMSVARESKYGHLLPNVIVSYHAAERFVNRILHEDRQAFSTDIEETIIDRFKQAYECEDEWVPYVGARIDNDGIVYVYREKEFPQNTKEIMTVYPFDSKRNTMITIPPDVADLINDDTTL